MHEEAQPERKIDRFAHWLDNTFWFHYKWYYFFGVFVAVLLIASVISFVTKVTPDWTVTYVHTGSADPDPSALKALFSRSVTDESGNGKIQLDFQEYSGSGELGRMDILGLARDSAHILYVLDTPVKQLAEQLGWLLPGDSVSIGSGFWAAVLDAKPVAYTLAEYEQYGYDQESIDEANEYQLEKHADQVALAREILSRMG